MSSSAYGSIKKLEYDELDLFLHFQVTGNDDAPWFAFNVQKIKEVTEEYSMTALPPQHAPFVAIIDLRGTAIPVLDVAGFVGDDHAQAPRKRVLICDIQGYYLGIFIGRTGRILDRRNSEHLPLPEAISRVNTSFVNGLIKTSEGYVYTLDIEAILESLDIMLDKSTIAKDVHPRFQGLRALVVEDSKLFQKKTKLLFEKLGLETVMADNGADGLKRLEEHSYRFDFIFSDLEMPIMNGIDFIRELKKRPPARDIPILINSSLSNPALIRDIENEQLGRYIVKFDEDLIYKELDILLGKKPARNEPQ